MSLRSSLDKLHRTVPLWVKLVYLLDEWLDYQILSPLSSRLMQFRHALLDRFCHCSQCEKRRAEWAEPTRTM